MVNPNYYKPVVLPEQNLEISLESGAKDEYYNKLLNVILTLSTINEADTLTEIKNKLEAVGTFRSETELSFSLEKDFDIGEKKSSFLKELLVKLMVKK